MSSEALATRIAVRAGVPGPAVERVFGEHDFSPILAGARPRPIQLRRLRIAGSRPVEPLGEFDRVLEFGAGLTVLAADNLRGCVDRYIVVGLVIGNRRTPSEYSKVVSHRARRGVT
jgi:hypothetical protein